MAHEYVDDECNECMLFVKEVEDAKEWMCVVCDMEEILIPLDDTSHVLWHKYKLYCGHEAHPRCYRVWSKAQDTVGCPECGKQEKVEKNMYCYLCKNFGHSSQKCPIEKNVEEREYISWLWREHYGTF